MNKILICTAISFLSVFAFGNEAHSAQDKEQEIQVALSKVLALEYADFAESMHQIYWKYTYWTNVEFYHNRDGALSADLIKQFLPFKTKEQLDIFCYHTKKMSESVIKIKKMISFALNTPTSIAQEMQDKLKEIASIEPMLFCQGGGWYLSVNEQPPYYDTAVYESIFKYNESLSDKFKKYEKQVNRFRNLMMKLEYVDIFRVD